MTERLWIGLALTLVAGLLAGNCMLPMKFARRWPWESVWLVFSAFAVYAVSSVYLGTLGTSAGWALFQIFMTMTATASGVLTSEWKGSPRVAKFGMFAGLMLLSIATVLIAPKNS